MRASISKKNKALFNPFFKTVILGQPTKVSLKDALENPQKYINTAIGPLYEGYEELKKEVESRVEKADPHVIDMKEANRGDAFDPNRKTAKQAFQDKFKKDQERQRARIAKRVSKNLEQKKANEDKEKKAVAAALKKERAKSKKDA